MNSEIIFTIVVGTVLFIVLGVFVIVFLLQYQKRKFRHYNEMMQLKESVSQTILQSQLEIQEQTLKNISQEIHDNIGQVLSLAKLNLATTDILKAEIAQQKIEDSKNLVGKAIQDLRDLSKSLNTDYVNEMGLTRSLEYELEMIGKTGAYQANLKVEGSAYKLGPQKELILFRIVQEILNNIIKHAKASAIEVFINYLPDYFSLSVQDNGQGFDLDQLRAEQPGLGLKNMQTRAALIGATFEISSKGGKGTTVDIKIVHPIKAT
jgi:two-component system, NarL family, sensor kinase